ncbi:MAG: co-chaperone DjlA [Spirochaetaceae bacterium]
MSWFGKIAGGTIGFIIGGPLGAAGGAFLGHKLLDNDQNLSKHEEIQANYFVALFSMLGKMAKSDGLVTADEVQTVDYIITHNLRLGESQRKFAINVFNESKSSSFTFEDFANNFYRLNSHSPSILFTMLSLLFEVAKADGKLHPNEERLLEKAQKIFNISDSDYHNLKTQHFPAETSDKYYAILNCSEADSDAALKSSYRKLVREFHPDKIANKGMPDEFNTYAKNKFQEIQDAFDYIKEIREI